MIKEDWVERQLEMIKEILKEAVGASRENKLPDAEKKLQEAEAILDSIEDERDEALKLRSQLFNEVGVLGSRTNNPAKALSGYRRSVQAADALAARGGEEQMLMERITTLVNMGILCAATQQAAEGVQASQRALVLLEQVGAENNHGRLMRVFGHYHLALNLHMSGQRAEAAQSIKAAADAGLKELEGGQDLRPMLIEMFSNAGRIHADLGDFEEAARLARHGADFALALFERQRQQHFLRQYVTLEMDLMSFHERLQRFDKAENSFFKVLDLLPDDANVVKRGESFYQQLLTLGDEVLEAGGLPRAEVEESLRDLRARARV